VSSHAAGGRVVVRFKAPLGVSGTAAVALEDYARELTRARAAEALPAESDPDRLLGVALEAPLEPPTGAVLEDIEAFARELAEHEGSGLGWS
jgi:hypothetical protein